MNEYIQKKLLRWLASLDIPLKSEKQTEEQNKQKILFPIYIFFKERFVQHSGLLPVHKNNVDIR